MGEAMMTAAATKPSLLIVDDRPENLLVMEAILADLDVNLVKVSSGREALKQLLDRDFAAILLDVMMADMDGFETAAMIRDRPRSKHTPILFLTAFQKSEQHLWRGYSLGAVDYMVKPIVPEVLRSKVAVFVDLHEQAQRVRDDAEARIQQDRAAHERELAKVREGAGSQKTRSATASRHEGVTREAELLRFFELSEDLLCITDVEGRIKQANPALAEAFGAESLAGKPLAELVLPEDRGSLAKAFACLGAGERRFHVEVRTPAKDGEGRHVEWRATSYPEDGLVYAIGRDVTELRRMDEVKNEFISTVSHELRTPLTSIGGSLRLLSGKLAEEFPQKAKRAIEIAVRNCDRLSFLLNDLLDVERIESGRMEVHLAREALLPLVLKTVEATKEYADSLEVTFAVAAPEGDVEVMTDGARFGQVLTNFLSNAAKFSPPKGTVVVHVTRRDGRARVAVTDRGPGIPEEFRARIFRKFAQAEVVDERRRGGTGLGLAIARSLVELLGGEIGFYDESGGGTTFFVDLPVA